MKVFFRSANHRNWPHFWRSHFCFCTFQVGLDIITDGEIERETYYLHLGRNLKGIDFDNVKEKEGRNGACTFNAPIVRGKLELKVCGNKIAYLKKVQIWKYCGHFYICGQRLLFFLAGRSCVLGGVGQSCEGCGRDLVKEGWALPLPKDQTCGQVHHSWTHDFVGGPGRPALRTGKQTPAYWRHNSLHPSGEITEHECKTSKNDKGFKRWSFFNAGDCVSGWARMQGYTAGRAGSHEASGGKTHYSKK